jgi:hypothetical protein
LHPAAVASRPRPAAQVARVKALLIFSLPVG